MQSINKSINSEQACYLTGLLDIHIFIGRAFGKPRHGHDVTGQSDNKTCAGGRTDIAYRNFETSGPAKNLTVIGERVLGFCNAHGQIPEPVFSILRIAVSACFEYVTDPAP